MRPLLCLCSMFKNEEPTVQVTLESAKPFVDEWFMSDTGSSDRTVDIVREVMPSGAGRISPVDPIECVLKSGKRVFDFAANRNVVLDGYELSESPAVFTVFLSADETLVGGDKLRAYLEEHRDDDRGAYAVEVKSGTRAFAYTRVLRVDAKWRYKGVIHEVPTSPDGNVQTDRLIPGVMIVHAPSDPTRKMSRVREVDRLVLEETVDDPSLSTGEKLQSMLMLAETYALIAADEKDKTEGKVDLASPWVSFQLAAMAMYTRYANAADGIDPDMALYALVMYYSLVGEVPFFYTHGDMVARLKLFVETKPGLPEVHFMLAKHAAFVDPRLGLHYGVESAKVAKRALAGVRRSNLETTLEWRSLLLASDCADAVAEGTKDIAQKISRKSTARKLREAAIKAGAPVRLEREPETEPAKTEG